MELDEEARCRPDDRRAAEQAEGHTRELAAGPADDLRALLHRMEGSKHFLPGDHADRVSPAISELLQAWVQTMNRYLN